MPSFGDFVVVTLLWCFTLFLLASMFLWTVGYRFRKEQNAYLYYPGEPAESRFECETPSSLGMSNAEDISIVTPDGVTLRGFMLWPSPPPHPSGDKQPTSPLLSTTGTAATREGGGSAASTPPNAQPAFMLIYFHGNAGNVGHRVPIAAAMVAKMHCAVLMMDYRGFGLSDDAEVDQEGLERDAEACLDFVVGDRRLPQERIFVMGTSLGGAVTIHLAAKAQNARHIAGVIVENTFTSISAMTSVIGTQLISRAVPCPSMMLCLFLYYLQPLVLRIGWRSIRQVASVPVPMLFLSGGKDELVPPVQMRQLYASACQSQSKKIRRLLEFPDGMHNNMALMPGYLDAIQGFVQEVEQSQLVDVV